MYFIFLLPLSLIPYVLSLSSPPQQIFSNPTRDTSPFRIPTTRESAVQARRILHLSSIATLSTNYPHHASASWSLDDSASSTPPLDIAGAPIGLMDYYVSCAPRPYDPTILAVNIATSFRNTASGSNITLSLRWHPPSSTPPSDDLYLYSPANMPRFSLLGYMERIPQDEVENAQVETCFLDKHPDAELWIPGNDIHESWWGRLVVEGVYFFGGFGDRAFIGWIPVEIWRGVEQWEVEGCKLVGEDGWGKGQTTCGVAKGEDWRV